MSAPPTETTAANGTDFVSWRHCEVHTRSTFNILSLCLSTLVICVWNAVHHNVPRPWTPPWRVYLGRFYGFLVGLFLPEVLVLNALNEFIEAREDVKGINELPTAPSPNIHFDFSPGVSPASPSSAQRPSVLSVLTAAYWTKHWRTRPETFQWTMTHAFHVNARGFAAQLESGRIIYLSSYSIKTLWDSDSKIRPLFSAEAVNDRGKAGALAKALFCWQLLVFATSCIARRAEHLPLSLLEITTLAHSVCGLAAFALWWHKPHSVDEAVFVPIDESLEEKISWAQPTRSYHSDHAAMRGMSILLGGREPVPRAVLSSLAVVALYGLPHLIALSNEFPTLAERRCWQVCTAIIIGTPFITVAIGFLNDRLTSPWRSFWAIIFGVVIVYGMASCFIVAESFRQLFALPAGAFLSPAFVCYLPHFS